MRRIVGWPALLALGSLAVVLFASPLFRTLGFEYSAISALLLSIAVGFSSARPTQDIKSALLKNAQRAVFWSGIPLLISFVSLIFLPNCAFGEGLRFYLLIALPTALLAAGFGTALGALSSSGKKAKWRYAVFWILTFVISLLPGYLFPQLFTYGWQYGFFPGLVWDENIDLTRSYGWHLAEWTCLAVILLQLAQERVSKKRNREVWAKLLTTGLAYIALLAMRGENRIITTHDRVMEYLTLTDTIHGGARLHYRGSSLTNEEHAMLVENIDWYLHDIRERLKLTDTSPVDIYLYPSTDALYQYVGTRSASIAKPWMRELHIAKENVESMKHELTHVLLREWGSFPFYASWSTALTEGVAMSMEPSYDGMHTLHEHAAAIMEMKLGSGMSNIMGFAGFASGASTTSYVLAGSFTNWLLENYGADKLSAVYRSIDFDQAYATSLRELEYTWQGELKTHYSKLDHYDSLRTRFYFERQSILARPCLRRLGKLNEEAREAMDAGDYRTALDRYEEISHETPSINAIRGKVIAYLRMGDVANATHTLDTAHIDDHPQKLSFALMKGDLIDERYLDTLINAKLSSGSYLTVWAHRQIKDPRAYMTKLYLSKSPLNDLPPEGDTASDSEKIAINILNAQAYESEGLLGEARTRYREALGNPWGIPDSLKRSWIYQLLVQKYLAVGGDPLDIPSVYLVGGLGKEIEELQSRAAYLKSRSTNANPSVK